MRATAILTVVYAHAYSLIEHKYPGLSHINIEGVTLFFVLSGYLIGRILINDSQKKGCNSSTLLVFWSRRWLRTLPAYFFVLIILIIFSVTLEHALPSNIWLYFVFSQNIAWSHPEFFGEAWSLAVEEWFYISVPLVLFFIVYSTKTSVSRAILIISVAVILGSIAIRAARLQVGDIHSTSEWDLALRKIKVVPSAKLLIS